MKLTTLCLLIFMVAATGTAAADRVEQINQEIRDQGYEWVAKDNEAARLHRELGWYGGGPLTSVGWPEDLGVFETRGAKNLPAQLDWRDLDGGNYVTSVKNQQSCGSCWAFATVGPMESVIAFAEGWTDPKVDLSEQQMVSCSTAGDCLRGGLTTSSFQYAKQTGITREECFPYRARDASTGLTCDKMCDAWRDDLFKIDDWEVVSLTGFNIQAMKEALQQGPIAASIIIYEDFMYYNDGIYENTDWLPQGLHAVTIIGYDDAQQYWIVKNSWGVTWGQMGYGKIRYGTALIGSMSILPVYTSRNLGPEPDDDDDGDDDDDAGDDDDAVDDDDAAGDDDWVDESDDDDDDDSGCCG